MKTTASRFLAALLVLSGIAAITVANAAPNWTCGGSTTEWGDSANWTANDGNHFWIDPYQGATHYNMTFNRDGRTYTGDPEDKSDGVFYEKIA